MVRSAREVSAGKRKMPTVGGEGGGAGHRRHAARIHGTSVLRPLEAEQHDTRLPGRDRVLP